MNSPTAVDLSNCDREPIHVPGSIQPHAMLMVLREPVLEIVHVSANVGPLLGLPPAEMVGRPLGAVLEPGDVEHLRQRILPEIHEASPRYMPPMRFQQRPELFEALVHRLDGLIYLELERWTAEESSVPQEVYGMLRSALLHVERAPSLTDFCNRAAQTVREFSGFDRVMVYRFSEDGSGSVIAEARREDLESYLGLHYPAADIPQQARELFKRSQVRLNPDVRYRPVPMIPENRPDDNRPLDMSYCVTRSMSPIHAEYLQNMGVDASMSISIVVDDRLWGLFACHHYAPRYVPHGSRMACEFLAHTLSLQVAGKEAADQRQYSTLLEKNITRTVDRLEEEHDLPLALGLPDTMPVGIQAGGAALLFNNQVHLVGRTPGETVVRQLSALLSQGMADPVWATDRLGSLFPELAGTAATASGVLSSRLSKQAQAYLFWFKPEESLTVSWAGDPNKPVNVGPHGDRLTPRKSFALWQETVKGRSQPWLACELDAARRLRQALLEYFVRHTEYLVRINTDLEERNRQLDSFAYVASHDLKEPLRGIRNYTEFLLEDFGSALPDEGRAYANTILRLAGRMEMLLDSLLHYSRLSRLELHAREVNLGAAVADALEMLVTRVEESGLRVSMPEPLPTVMGDADRLAEVFTNLLSNAVKYNDKARPEVTIRHERLSNEPFVVIHVEDNGIGISHEHRNIVFQIFKRLHGRDQYGGGVGAGLTIVKKIIERHDGRIWIDSEPGKGATFSFTLPLPHHHASQASHPVIPRC